MNWEHSLKLALFKVDCANVDLVQYTMVVYHDTSTKREAVFDCCFPINR